MIGGTTKALLNTTRPRVIPWRGSMRQLSSCSCAHSGVRGESGRITTYDANQNFYGGSRWRRRRIRSIGCSIFTQRRLYADVIHREQIKIPPFPEDEEEIRQVEEKILQFNQNIEAASQVLSEDPVMRVVAFSNSLKYELHPLQLMVLKVAKNSNPKIYHTKRRDAAFLNFKITQDTGVTKDHPGALSFLIWSGKDKDYFIYEDGVVVGWGMDEVDQQSIQQLLKSDSKQSLMLKEDMTYKFGEKAFLDAERDTLILTSKNEFLEKVSISFAMARSVKLDAIEIEVENALNQAKQLKFDSSTKTSKFKRALSLINEPREQLARLHKLSYDLSVRARVMEPPIFLWDKPHFFTELYLTTGKYYDFETRQDVVQKKLDLPMNYWTLEKDHATAIMGWRLEKMIIALILVEVFLNILEKSEHWEDFTWEKAMAYLFGYPYTPKKKHSALGDEYEIVSETYEILEPAKQK